MYSLGDSVARGRAKELQTTPDRSAAGSRRESLLPMTPPADLRTRELLAEAAAAVVDDSGAEPSTPGSAWGAVSSSSLFQQVSMPQHAFHDIIDSMSVQMFSAEQIAAMVANSEPMQVWTGCGLCWPSSALCLASISPPVCYASHRLIPYPYTAILPHLVQQVEGREVYPGTFKGVHVRVWKACISHSVSYLELKKAYSKYCIAHPNICAVLGVCIQVRGGQDHWGGA